MKGYFPFLERDDVPPPSDESASYNCIGWALGRDDQWWQKEPRRGGRTWPSDVEADLAGWLTIFERNGYTVCDDSAYEPGYDKVAIYCQEDLPKHALRQLPDGRWASKLGDWEDIEHPNVDDLRGPKYGRRIIVLKRPTADEAGES